MKRRSVVLFVVVLLASLVMSRFAASVPAARAEGEASSDATLAALESQLVAEYRNAYESVLRTAKTGQISSQQLRDAKNAYLHAQVEFAKTKAERVKFLEELARDAAATLEGLQRRQKSGAITYHDVFVGRVSLLRAKIEIEKEKQRSE